MTQVSQPFLLSGPIPSNRLVHNLDQCSLPWLCVCVLYNYMQTYSCKHMYTGAPTHSVNKYLWVFCWLFRLTL